MRADRTCTPAAAEGVEGGLVEEASLAVKEGAGAAREMEEGGREGV